MPIEYAPNELDVVSRNSLALLQTREATEKVAQYAESYLRTKLREASFAWDVLPPRTLDDTLLERSTEYDVPIKIEELEPDATATVLNFRGRADVSYIRQKRIAIPFMTISSSRFQKNESELRVSRSPLTKIIEENALLEMQAQLDDTWMFHCRDAVAATGLEVKNTAEDTLSTSFLQRISKKLIGEERRLSVLLMTQMLWTDILAWGSEMAGTDWVASKTEKGVKANSLLG